jgi:hypothetical protein
VRHGSGQGVFSWRQLLVAMPGQPDAGRVHLSDVTVRPGGGG